MRKINKKGIGTLVTLILTAALIIVLYFVIKTVLSATLGE